MTKTRWFRLTALLTMVVLGAIFLWSGREKEPVYKGQPLQYWLRGYDPTLRTLAGINAARAPTRQDADDAVVALGTNAIPDLLRMLIHRQSSLVPPLWAIGQKLHLVKTPSPNPYVPNLAAQLAFAALGSNGAAAVPELIKMYDSYPDPSSRTSILFVLGCIGPQAKEALPVMLRAMTNSCNSMRLNAVNALGRTETNAAQAAPILIRCLNDSIPLIQQRAMVELGKFGKEARTAMPALLQLLHHLKYDPTTAAAPPKAPGQGSATSILGGFPGADIVPFPESMTLGLPGPWKAPLITADVTVGVLWEIDPDAAADAHLKPPK